jgi:hypothetical protein
MEIFVKLNCKMLSLVLIAAVGVLPSIASAQVNTVGFCVKPGSRNSFYPIVNRATKCRDGFVKALLPTQTPSLDSLQTGPTGPQGATVPQGETGAQGPQGPTGAKGDAGLVNLGSCTQVSASRTGSGEETQKVYCSEGNFMLSASWDVSNQATATTYKKDLFSTTQSGPYNYPVGVEVRAYQLAGQYTLNVTATCCAATLGNNN